jgi:hypothetical protein
MYLSLKKKLSAISFTKRTAGYASQRGFRSKHEISDHLRWLLKSVHGKKPLTPCQFSQVGWSEGACELGLLCQKISCQDMLHKGVLRQRLMMALLFSPGWVIISMRSLAINSASSGSKFPLASWQDRHAGNTFPTQFAPPRLTHGMRNEGNYPHT